MPDDAFVFSPVPDGSRPWTVDHFSKLWTRVRATIGLQHVRLHDLRHFHGTELAAAGVPMTTVRDRLRCAVDMDVASSVVDAVVVEG